jgi:hypothetical protein
MTRAVIENNSGLVSVNAEIGADANELAIMFFRAMVGNGFHTSTVIASMAEVVDELIEAYDLD